MSGPLHIADWLVIAAYFAAIGWMGWRFSKKNKDTEEYFVGGALSGAGRSG
jgi:Na+/proline symporter